jgi:hypothetical protein
MEPSGPGGRTLEPPTDVDRAGVLQVAAADWPLQATPTVADRCTYRLAESTGYPWVATSMRLPETYGHDLCRPALSKILDAKSEPKDFTTDATSYILSHENH